MWQRIYFRGRGKFYDTRLSPCRKKRGAGNMQKRLRSWRGNNGTYRKVSYLSVSAAAYKRGRDYFVGFGRLVFRNVLRRSGRVAFRKYFTSHTVYQIHIEKEVQKRSV